MVKENKEKSNIIESFKEFERNTKLISEKGCGILYFLDNEHALFFGLKVIPPVLNLKKTKEVFKLDHPSFYINGRPIFILYRGIPYSLELDLRELQKHKIRIKNYTSDEIHAKIHSTYTNVIFRRKFLNIQNIGMMILSNVVCILITALIYTQKISGLKETIKVLQTQLGLGG